MYGHTVRHAFVGCPLETLELHGNNLIQWEAIQRAHRKWFSVL
jgi:hypothetical protein